MLVIRFRMSSSALIVLRALLNAIFLLPFLAAQSPGYEHVGQALRFCLSDLVKMKAVPARTSFFGFLISVCLSASRFDRLRCLLLHSSRLSSLSTSVSRIAGRCDGV